MDVEMYKFPVLNSDSVGVVEKTYCELARKYRNGEPLQPEMIDWMDTANNWLMTAASKL